MGIPSVLTIILGAVIAILLTLYLYFTWHFNYWKKRGVAGPCPRPFLGTYPKTATLRIDSNILQEADEIYQKYWRKQLFVGTFEHAGPLLLVLDPELARDVLSKYFKHFHYNASADTVEPTKNPMLGGSPFAHKGDEWKRIRSEVSMGLTLLKVKAMYPIVENIGKRIVEYIDAQIESGMNHYVPKELAERFTAEAVSNCGYGLESNSFGKYSEFLTEARKSFAQSTWTAYHSHLIRVFPFLHKIYPLRWMPQESTDWFIHLTEHAIKIRKQSGERRDDYLNSLLELQAKRGSSTLDLAIHGYTLFLDGYETSSHFLGSILLLLAEYPEVQRKLRAEIASHGKIGFDDLCRMPYLELVFSEGLRYGPFPFPLWRMCTEDIDLTDSDGTKVTIERGTRVLFPTQSLHNHPEFYAKPDVFNPERFDGSDGRDLKYYTNAGVFMPFGDGPRMCPGMRFATMQIKTAICALVKNFEIRKTTEKSEAQPGLFFFAATNNKIEFRRL